MNRRQFIKRSIVFVGALFVGKFVSVEAKKLTETKELQLGTNSLPYYIAFTYETIKGKVWTGNIEVLCADDPQQAVEAALLICHNITPNGQIEGDISARIYSDIQRTYLIDTLQWTKTNKDNFKYIHLL